MVITPGKERSNREGVSTASHKAPRKLGKQQNIPDSTVAVAHAEEAVLATSRGRKIYRPQHFDI